MSQNDIGLFCWVARASGPCVARASRPRRAGHGRCVPGGRVAGILPADRTREAPIGKRQAVRRSQCARKGISSSDPWLVPRDLRGNGPCGRGCASRGYNGIRSAPVRACLLSGSVVGGRPWLDKVLGLWKDAKAVGLAGRDGGELVRCQPI